jgi:hypothetical protein
MSATRSVWASSSWQLTLVIKKESKGSLVLSIPLTVSPDASPVQDGAFVSGTANQLKPEGKASFISQEGLQIVEFSMGGWKLLPPAGGRKGIASKLRMWLDLQTSCRRNDIQLSSGERLYLEANCWREDEFEIGRSAYQPYFTAYQLAQQKLEAQISHDTGDRRLDGTDPLQTLAAYSDVAKLVAQRDEKLRLLQEAELVYPRDVESIVEGPWPGATEWLFIDPTLLSIKRRKVFLDEYQTIGEWYAKPILQDDEFDLIDIDDTS